MLIEGIPEGYELARIGAPKQNEPYLTPRGRIDIAEGNFDGCGYAVLRKIEKPKRYRPFANAAEFEPFRDRWVRHKSNSDSCMRIDGYGNKGVTIQGCVHDFDEMLEDRTFDDGTPFGIEVTE